MKPLQNQSVWLNNLPFLMLPPLFGAGNFVVGKVVSDEVPPFTLAFGRWVLAFVVLLPFAWPHVRRDWPLYGQNLPRIAAGVGRILVSDTFFGCGNICSIRKIVGFKNPTYDKLNGESSCNTAVFITLVALISSRWSRINANLF